MKKVSDILAARSGNLSLEFFPPKDKADWDGLLATLAELAPLSPPYVSVTYGAGGSSRDRTLELARRIQQETNIPVVAHLTCVGSSRDEMRSIVEEFLEAGIVNILALRGDPPKNEPDWIPASDGFAYAAQLVAFLRDFFPGLCIGVAGFPEGHPSTPNRLLEIDYLKEKVEAGADYIVTQLFFDNRDFFDFEARCRLAGIAVPIVAGLLPLTSKSGMVRMAELAAGARVPAPLLGPVLGAADDLQVAAHGTEWTAAQCRELLARGVAGIHFYTLNSSAAVLEVFGHLRQNS